jgi:hypothetical protein
MADANKTEIVIYQTEDGLIKIDVRMDLLLISLLELIEIVVTMKQRINNELQTRMLFGTDSRKSLKRSIGK